MTKYKFALVGCGRISKRHSDLLGNREIQDASLVSVCDTNIDRAAELGRKYDVPYYSDMDDMMQSELIDVVVVLTESGNHARHVINLSKYKKTIVVEKPMALTLEDADRMIRACDIAGVKLYVVKQNRFNLPVQKLHQAIESGRFGKIVIGTVRVRWCRTQDYYDQDSWRGSWSMDGGVLTNQASHHVDMLEWMLGDVQSVFAMSSTALVDIEAEDTVIVNLRFKNGALGIIEATTATRPKDLEGSISILGENGAVVIGGYSVNKMVTWQFDKMDSEDDLILDTYSENPPNVYGFGHKSFYEKLIKSLSGSSDSLIIDGLEGRKSLELISSIYESIETKKEVQLGIKPSNCRLGKSA